MRTYPFVGTWRHLSRLARLDLVNSHDNTDIHDENQRHRNSVESVDHGVAVPQIVCGIVLRKHAEGRQYDRYEGPRYAEQPHNAKCGVERPVPGEPAARVLEGVHDGDVAVDGEEKGVGHGGGREQLKRLQYKTISKVTQSRFSFDSCSPSSACSR